MNFAASWIHRHRWLNFPAAMLVVLLQRTPALRLLFAAEEYVIASPLGAVLRSAAVALGSLGALHTLAGATTLTVQQGQLEVLRIDTGTRVNIPATGSVGAPITPILLAVTGEAGGQKPQSYQITGLPPGLSSPGINANGVVNVSALTGVATISGTPTTAGDFVVRILAWEFPNGPVAGNDYFPSTGPASLTIRITGSATVAPSITTQPLGQIANVGANVVFTVSATGTPAPAYQWQRNGASIAGATSATLTLLNVQSADAGDYRAIASNSAGSVVSATATLSVVAPNSAARLSNLSVRTTMAASQTLIVGVVVNGGSRNILVRAAGPALAGFGLGGAMADPRLDLFNDAALVVTNDDWPATLAPTFASVGAFGFTSGSKDAALLQNIQGARSIQARGTGAGTVLVEAYDTGEPTSAHLINVSARNRVGVGDDILIAGFTVAGAPSEQKPLLIRAVGPKLGAFGVSGFLVDPKLELYRGAEKLTENDNWAASLATTFTAVGAFQLDANSRDAALLTSLPPGSYTVQVRGADGGTGEALIEIYEVP